MNPIFLAFLAAAPAVQAGESTFDPVRLVETVQPAVVVVRLLDRAGRETASGSGFFTADGWVATARHGLVGASGAQIVLHDGTVMEVAGIVAEDAARDLLLLQARLPDGAAPPRGLPLADELPRPGTPVLAFGSPLGLGAAVSDGIVSGAGEQPGLGMVLTVSTPISPGSSGGPIVDRRGVAVGMVLAQNLGAQNLNYAAPATQLRALAVATPEPVSAWVKRVRSAPPPAPVRELLRTAEMALRFGDGKRALARARQARQMAPDAAQAWLVEALSLEAVGNHEAALQGCRKALALGGDDAGVQTGGGILMGNLYRYEEEVAAYMRALEIEPARAAAMINLGISYQERGALEQAEGWFRRALAVEPQNASALGGLGQVAGDRGRHEEALELFQRADAAQPGDPWILGNLGAALARLGRGDEARQTLGRCLAGDPDHVEGREILARLLGEAEQRDEQYAHLKEVLRRAPGSIEAHAQMGDLMLARGDRAAAFDEYRILHGLDAARAQALLERIYP
jgi:tetratricopeptide (TPR) repeat protein